MIPTDATLRAFADAAQSLRLYRRAELRDPATDEVLVDRLYVDPLAANSALETMLRPNTTFIVGRKGTGKSTIFQRAQHEIRQRPNSVSAYVDIKTVYESAAVDPALLERVATASAAFPAFDAQRLLLYRAFIRAVLADIQKELSDQIRENLLSQIREAFEGARTAAIEALDELASGAFDTNDTDITAVTTRAIKATIEEQKATGGGVSVNVGSGGANASASLEGSSQTGTSDEHVYSKVVLRTFDVTAIIDDLKQILGWLGVRHLYVFIDDFSELPEEAMTVFVDTVLAPLNNWSDELIKFKVAGYPGRLYFGKIDQTKMDELYLDTYKLYGMHDLNTMEDKAIDFTKRLVENRFEHFVQMPFADFCEGEMDDLYRTLFYATMGNPRILGHLLTYLRESHVVYGKKIGIRAVNDASQKYFDEKVEPFFGIQKFAHKHFGERSSLFSLKELLESIVGKARELRNYKGSAVTQDIKGRTPSSHFHIVMELDSLLTTLELNFFLTKYYEMKDRDGRAVSVYALNYGLCNKHSIAFGRPEGKREFRLYFVERIFDYTSIMRKYLESSQEIRCDTCDAVHSLAKLDSIRLFDMMCPTCKEGRCQVVNLSRRYEQILEEIDEHLLLPATELGILETLYVEAKELGAKEIAAELDCSYQLVGWRGKFMEERGLVSRRKNEKQRRLYNLTDRAREDYFEGNESRHLNISDEEDPPSK